MARPKFKIGQAVRFQHWLSKPGNAWEVTGTITDIQPKAYGNLPRVVVNDFYALKGYRRLTAL